MKEHGPVIKTDGTTAHVIFSKTANCARCNACSIGKDKDMVVEVDNSIKARKGDHVIVEVNEGQALIDVCHFTQEE